MINSREIAERFGKQSKHVNEAIRNLLKRNPELSKHFTKSSYLSNRGRYENQFEMDDIGVDILINKFKYNIRSARFEYKYLNEIKDFLNEMGIVFIPQYQVCNYRIDLYIPQFDVGIEIDEEEHKFKKEYDSKRQNYIENKINCRFIRINEGESCGKAIAKISRELNLTAYKCG